MAKIETYFDCDLKKAVQVQPLNGNVFSLDNNGNRIGVRIFDNGVKTTVTGTVTGRAILADNSTVNLNGGLTTVNGQSVAYIDVPQGALLIPGTIKITIQLTASGVITTLAAILSTVYQTKTDNVITPSAQVIADWNAMISSAIQAQDAAIAAETAARIAADSDLRSALNIVENNADALYTDTKENVTRILASETGFYSVGSETLNPAATTYKTYLIPCIPGQAFHLYGYVVGGQWANAYAVVRYLTANKKLLSDIGSNSGNYNYDNDITAPTDCYFITFTVNTQATNERIEKKTFGTAEKSKRVSSIYSDYATDKHRILKSVLTEDGFYSPNLTQLTSSSSYKTKWFEVYPSEELYIITRFGGGSYANSIDYIRFYDAEKKCFSNAYSSAAGDNNISTLISVPAWASYMIVTCGAAYESNQRIYRKPTYAIFIGDSYTQASSLASAGLDQSKRFSSLLCDRYGLIEKNYAVGGMGFVIGETPYITQLQTAIADTTYDHDFVKYIFISGGRNDNEYILEHATEEKTAVLNVFDTAMTNYPTAKIIFTPMLWDYNLLQQQQYRAYRLFSQCCEGRAISMVPNAYMWNMGMKENILSDNVHPNIEGHAVIANHIANALETGFSYPYTNSVTLEPTSSKISSEGGKYVAILNENGRLQFNAEFTITENTTRWENLFSYTSTDENNPFIFSQYGQRLPIYNPATNEINTLILTKTNTSDGYTITANVNGVVLTPGWWVSMETSIPFGLVNFAHVE